VNQAELSAPPKKRVFLLKNEIPRKKEGLVDYVIN
jgi:hypothetical protein